MGNGSRRRRMRPAFERLDARWLPAGFTPSQVAAAYGLASIALPTPSGGTVPGDGSGQTIAIVTAYHNPNLLSDLKVFNQTFGLPDADVRVVNMAGDATSDIWASESAMDVQWAHALAPGASIVLVEAASESSDDVLHAIEVARQTPGVVAVSMSLGFTETAGQHVYDDLFTTPAGHTGITFIAASGDHGPAGGAMYPASSPNVLGVGGTSLSLDDAGAVASETVWAKSASGVGRFAPRAAYQQAFTASPRRSTPDVSFLGDPSTGVRVYETPPGATEGSWRVVAGTSLGAPAWAAIVAIVSQGRALQGMPSLDGPSETLPLLYSLAGVGFRGVSGGATPTAAGLGVPVGSTLIPAMIRHAGSRSTPPAQAQAAEPVTAQPAPTPRQPARRQPVVRRRAVVSPPPNRAAARQARLARQAFGPRRTSLAP